MPRSSAVAVCATSAACATPASVAASAPSGAATVIPADPSAAASGGASDDSGGGAGLSRNRVQVVANDYPEGLYVLAGSDGTGNAYFVEVCTRVPLTANCPDFFGVMSLMRPADALGPMAPAAGPYGAVRLNGPWSSALAQAAAAAADMPSAVLTSACAPPPGIDGQRKAVFSWGWDFGSLPPSLAFSGFVAVYRRYPLTRLHPGSYNVQFLKPAAVRLAVIVKFLDANPDLAGKSRPDGSPLAEREVIATTDTPNMVIPMGNVTEVTFVFSVPPIHMLDYVEKMSAACVMTQNVWIAELFAIVAVAVVAFLG
ncbi:hypothetical protein GPECTOR_1g183 [Gonium pectorale]|uniref:Uncharacterized protein n=1 Tax=Gonium pectorale TaxID=33097 RepID=A0A150H280_GONPE|nr:hypothetical protein GPECTOR_1g183 [Gonium pectorale]|eukprot:KXZ56211.1 hypothetical protein GPECTOR_1g183 [Gonium pectorale]